jgi:hypothetical protein
MKIEEVSEHHGIYALPRIDHSLDLIGYGCVGEEINEDTPIQKMKLNLKITLDDDYKNTKNYICYCFFEQYGSD